MSRGDPEGDPPQRPGRRPPWWPDNEQWPPEKWFGSSRHGPRGGWSGGRGDWQRRRRPFGCLLIVFILLAAATLTAGVWALAALVGLVSAPPIVLAGGLIATVAVGTAAFFAFRAVRGMGDAIDDLASAAEQIERGDYTARVEIRGPRPVRSLARAFNQMSARLADIDTGRRTFLADAAHELRTPLSIIEGQIEAIEDGIYPADAEHMAPIHDQIRALEKLIEDMRTVALAEAGGLTLDLRPTDLRELIEDTLTGFQAQADASGVVVDSDVPPEAAVAMIDEARVRQVLSNLLANSLRHTPSGGSVTVSVRAARASGWLEAEVADTGSGVAPELLPTIFERFVKEPGSPGSGLGLAICRDLVEAHGGVISIQSQPGGGTTVAFTLPTAGGDR